MELESGKLYYITHTQKIITEKHQSGLIVGAIFKNRNANYEYIGMSGKKHHFYDSESGYDLFLTKNEIINKVKLIDNETH